MIGLVDFVAEVKEKGKWLNPDEMESPQELLSRLNQWIAENDVEPINIETVTWPYVSGSGPQKTPERKLLTQGGWSNELNRCYRLWYRTK